MIEKVESEILTLRKATLADLKAVREYREEFMANSDSTDGTSGLRRFENMHSVVQPCLR